MFSNAKVGERVCSYTYGWGEIVECQCFMGTFRVKFENEIKVLYDTDGKFSPDAINQDLFYDEIKVEIPESAKRPKVEWKFPCYAKNSTGLVVYFDYFGNGRIIIPAGKVMVGDYLKEWPMEGFTPCTLEPKDCK